MVVERLSKRQGMTGLHVGDGNVQRLFPPDVPVVELELDHLRIVCTLEPGFWDGDPEIYDDRLSAWLESKRASGKLTSKHAAVALIPAGEHAFRLQPVGPREASMARYPVGFCA